MILWKIGGELMLDFKKLRLNKDDRDEQVVNESIKIENTNLRDIAIIGIDLKLPMANNKEEYWENLKNGKDCLTDIPDERKEDSDQLASYLGLGGIEPKYFRCSYIDEIDKFDYKFFRMSPKEASLMDPHQRLFLQTTWGAIEDAGYGGERIVGSRTGVYAGLSDLGGFSYMRLVSETEPQSLVTALSGNTSAMLPSRIAYLLDLKGPSMVIDTACSSSMVALNVACQALRNRQCEMALVGGVRLYHLPLEDRPLLGIESSDGRTRTFDESSDGTGVGEGVAAILLKPLGEAVRDRDNIYAVIKGGAINQDGNSMGITVPNAKAQSDVIEKAWKDARIDPTTISYIEAHGTGTMLGDPIEIDGIQKVFQKYTHQKQFCAIASVKTNIGHLYDMSGMASIIKVAMALKEGVLPPNIHFNIPNSKIDFQNSPVYVNNILQEWNTEGMTRRCGVSSFGISGTNCHMVLEEYKGNEENNEVKEKGLNVFTLSAKCRESLIEMLQNYSKFLERKKDIFIEDICYTANTGRGHYNFRIAIIASTKDELREKIHELLKSKYDMNTNNSIFSGSFNMVSSNTNKRKEKNDISEEEVKELSKITEEKLKQFIYSGKTDEKLLMEICDLYVRGAKIPLTDLYRGEKRNKVSLPTYRFKRERCWLEVPQGKRPGIYRNEFISQLDKENISDEMARELRTIINKYKKELITEDEEDNSKNIRLNGRADSKYTLVQQKLGRIWGEVLGCKEINIYESFYELGGDSIIAMKIVSLIDKFIGAHINVGDILKYNTIDELGKYVNDQYLSVGSQAYLPLKIEKTDQRDAYPASSAQKRMYIMNTVNKMDISYNLPGAVILEGNLDVEKYKAVIEHLVKRHDTLRTSFELLESGEVVQHIHNEVEITIVEEEANGREINEIINEFVSPFDLSKAPLIRMKLVKLDENKYLSMYDMHHIISDGSSAGVIIGEISSLYNDMQLPELSIQYKDYAVWHNNFLNSEYVKKQEDYWISVFGEEIPTLNIPTDYPRPSVKSIEGNRIEMVLDKNLSSKINKLALDTGSTLYMVMLAAYNVLLSKYTLQEDIIVGTPIAGRHYSGTENQIGMFVNTLAMRNYPSGNKTILEFIEEVKINTMKAFENQDYQFEEIVNKLNIIRDPRRNPIFDTMFALQSMIIPEIEAKDLKTEYYELEHKVSRFDLFMEAWHKNKEITLKLEYSTQLFKKETAKNIIENYIKILESVAKNVEVKINEIELDSSYQIMDDMGDEIVEFNF